MRKFITTHIKVIFSTEFIFVLFLFSGRYKALLGFIPIDITLLLMIITFALLITKHLKTLVIQKYVLYLTLLFAILSTYVFASSVYSYSEVQAHEKTFRFIFVTGWAFIGTLLIIKNNESIYKFLTSITLIAFIMTISTIYNFMFFNTGSFITGLGTNYLGTATTISLGILIIYSAFLLKKETKKV
ncbi:MAG: hypothetical protein WCX48_11915, partial [Bacteroidales bacterium]